MMTPPHGPDDKQAHLWVVIVFALSTFPLDEFMMKSKGIADPGLLCPITVVSHSPKILQILTWIWQDLICSLWPEAAFLVWLQSKKRRFIATHS